MSLRCSAFTLLEIMIVVFLIGLLAGIGIPAWLRSRNHAQATTCISNLKQIQDAIDTWAIEKGKNSHNKVHYDDISSYLRREVMCPAGGLSFDDSYQLTRVGEPPMCLKIPDTHLLDYASSLQHGGASSP